MSACTLPIVFARMSGVRSGADGIESEQARVQRASLTVESMDVLTKHVISLNREPG